MADFLYEVDGHLARLTMNRPEHLNCFSEEMIHLWTAALEMRRRFCSVTNSAF